MKRIIMLLLTVAAFCSAASYAQSYRMVLEKTSGETLKIPTNQIKKMWFEPYENPNPNPNPGEGEDFTETVADMDLQMVYVEVGTITNGEKTVTLDHSYYIGKYEITQAQWAKVMGTYPSNSSGQNMPVENITWQEAKTFCEKLSEMTGKTYVLPTEAEWEFAARGGSKSQNYPYSGSNYISEVAWYNVNSDGGPHVVGSKAPNELGLYDMSGNVAEYCYSIWDGKSEFDGFSDRGYVRDNKLSMTGKGGHWNSDAVDNRVKSRNGVSRSSKSNYYGFRVVMLKEAPQAEQSAPKTNFTESAFGTEFDMIYVSGDGNDFHIGKYEVTQGLWKAVMGTTPSYFSGDDNLPVERVTWYDAQKFCMRLSAQTGRRYALPSSDEWFYAAKGGSQTHNYTYSGSNNVDEVAWYSENSNSRTHGIGTKMANELGIYDMSGNVWEWCEDLYSGSYRVSRGGSWNYDASYCKVSYWGNSNPSYRGFYIGFRLVLLP